MAMPCIGDLIAEAQLVWILFNSNLEEQVMATGLEVMAGVMWIRSCETLLATLLDKNRVVQRDQHHNAMSSLRLIVWRSRDNRDLSLD